MRWILIALLFVCGLNAMSQGVDKRTVSALDHIKCGYIEYGVKELNAAAVSNDLAAQFFLGVCYEKGIGVSQDSREAFRLYRRAAERGLPDAMQRLSVLYSHGWGVSIDNARSGEWLQRFEKKGGKLRLPDIYELYSEGLAHPENFALSPVAGAAVADSNSVVIKSPSVVNNITVVQQPAVLPTANPDANSVNDDVADNRGAEQAKSDVDQNIPVNKQANENTFALIIANENYQDVAAVPNALNDGDIFAEYCKNTLGMPASNVRLVKDATLNNIRREVSLMRQIADAYHGSANFIVYYAGHGLPDEASGSAYLLPVDGYGSDLSTCFKLDELYSVLGSMPSSRVVVLVDACFSGATRDNGMLASARGVAIKAKTGRLSGNVVVISASQGDETANAYPEQHHGLFTYYLLKKLNASNGEVKLGDLVSYILDNVVKKSLVINGKSQTPTVKTSQSVEGAWADWQLR